MFFFAKYFLGGFMLLSFISKSTENDLKRDGEKEWQIVHIWAPLARRYIYAFNLWERLFACKWNFPSLDGILYPLWLCLIELHNKEDRNHHDIITVNEIITILPYSSSSSSSYYRCQKATEDKNHHAIIITVIIVNIITILIITIIW